MRYRLKKFATLEQRVDSKLEKLESMRVKQKSLEDELKSLRSLRRVRLLADQSVIMVEKRISRLENMIKSSAEKISEESNRIEDFIDNNTL